MCASLKHGGFQSANLEGIGTRFFAPGKFLRLKLALQRFQPSRKREMIAVMTMGGGSGAWLPPANLHMLRSCRRSLLRDHRIWSANDELAVLAVGPAGLPIAIRRFFILSDAHG
jgi:hypothetical protein